MCAIDRHAFRVAFTCLAPPVVVRYHSMVSFAKPMARAVGRAAPPSKTAGTMRHENAGQRSMPDIPSTPGPVAAEPGGKPPCRPVVAIEPVVLATCLPGRADRVVWRAGCLRHAT